MQVEHPLLDRAGQHELEVALIELGDRVVLAPSAAQALGQLGLLDAGVLDRRRAALVEDGQVAVAVVPRVGDELDDLGGQAALGQRVGELDARAHRADRLDRVAVEPERAQLRVVERRQRVLVLLAPRQATRLAARRPSGPAAAGASATSTIFKPAPRRKMAKRSRSA